MQIKKNKNGKRKINSFNFPFCQLSIINIGKYFHILIDKYFARDNL